MSHLKPYLLLLTLLVATITKAQTLNLLKEFSAGNFSSLTEEYMPLGNDLCFTVGPNNYSIWKTNGTTAGTIVLHVGFTERPHLLAVYHNKIFFVANDGVHGNELWVTDGTVAGTQLFMDINPGTASAFYLPAFTSSFEVYAGACVLNNMLYFNPDDGLGPALWHTDGTVPGTSMITGLSTGIMPPYAINGKLFFMGLNNTVPSAFVSDGTQAGTQFLAVSISASAFIPLGNKVIFVASDTAIISPSSGSKRWLYATDGTPAGTVKLLLVDSMLSYAQNLKDNYAVVSGKLILWLPGKKLIVTDGTPAGSTILHTNLASENYNQTNRVWMVPFNGKAYFSAFDYLTNNCEMWESDGTIAGTHMAFDIAPTISSLPRHLTVANGKLYFKARDLVSIGIWQTDGTLANTVKLNSGTGGINASIVLAAQQGLPGALCYFNSKLYCSVGIDSTIGRELYTVDIPNSVSQNSLTEQRMTITPNPTQGIFFINAGSQKYAIQVLNMMGMVIWSKTDVQGQQQIDISSYPAGIYTVVVSLKGRAVSGKLILNN